VVLDTVRGSGIINELDQAPVNECGDLSTVRVRVACLEPIVT